MRNYSPKLMYFPLEVVSLFSLPHLLKREMTSKSHLAKGSALLPEAPTSRVVKNAAQRR